MNNKQVIFIMIILSIFFVECKESSTQKQSESLSVTSEDQWTEVTTKYAKNFNVTYHDGYKKVNLAFKSERREIDFSQTLILYPKGTQPPKIENTDSNPWYIEIPVETVAANDDGEITRLNNLGLIDKIVGMGGGGIYDPELRRRWENSHLHGRSI